MTQSDLNDFIFYLNSNGYEPVGALRIETSDWQRLSYNGEKKTKTSGGCKIIQNPDGSLFANFGSTKDPIGFRSWRSKNNREMTYEEKVAAKTARENYRAFLEKKEKERHEIIGRRLERVINRLQGAKNHHYLTKKGIQAHGIKIRTKGKQLIIPRYGIDGKIYSLQKIIQSSPVAVAKKLYFRGARGTGVFYPFFDMNTTPDVLIFAEGFATAASIKESTDLATICCFDSGALKGVVKEFSKKYPKARIIIAADHDQWTFAAGKKPKDLDTGFISGDDPRWQEWREAGYLHNVGVEKAKQAAASIEGAQVVFPDIPPDEPKKLTDFNDLMLQKGKEHIKILFDKILEIPKVQPEEELEGGGFESSFYDTLDVQPAPFEEYPEPKAPKGDLGLAFRVLGYNDGLFYYYPFAMRQIVALSAPAHTMQNLLQLDSLQNWERPYLNEEGKLSKRHQTIALYAAAQMIQIAEKRGVFVEESHIRGAGCWIDEGRVVLHCGDRLYVDGTYTEFFSLNSEYTYVAAPRLLKPAQTPLNNYEARRLRTICEAITWENRLSGTLLAGWLVIAPICAALQYRPHIYITGEAESGKSTVLDMVIKPVLGKMAMCVDGGTTEPSIRSAMAYDARPLVYDEAEPSPSMAEVLMLARKASTGAVVKKYGQRAFKARFCACFSAINPPVNKTADESRISFMHLKKNLRPTAMQEYEDLLVLIEEVIKPDFAERMIARTLQNMDTLISNIATFQKAMRRTIHGARASQQIGTMLAGVYLLGSTKAVSENEAIEIAAKFRWDEHTIVDQDSDPVRLVQWIVASLVKSRSGVEVSIGELVAQAKSYDTIVSEPADKLLRYYGIALKGERVLIASRSQNLAKLLKDTEWHERWGRTLSDVAGAEKVKIAYFSAGVKTSATSLPLDMFISSEPAAQTEIEF